jgi:hypothetical protein
MTPTPLLLATALALPAASAAAPTVKGTVLAPRPQTAPIGTSLPNRRVGVRAFLGARFGVALGSGAGAQYPVRTTDGGRTWHTDGPALHINAANAPFSVTTVSAASRSVQYAYGDGQVADVTSNGTARRPTWRVALFQGTVLAIVPSVQPHALVALVQLFGPHNPTVRYRSSDGGRTWHLTTSAID